MPLALEGHCISFINKVTTYDAPKIIEHIPGWFWKSEIIDELPSNFKIRSKLCQKLLDVDHNKNCIKSKFHTEIDDQCICLQCWSKLERYHKCIMRYNQIKPTIILERLDLKEYLNVKPIVILTPLKRKSTENNSPQAKRLRIPNKKYFGHDWIT